MIKSTIKASAIIALLLAVVYGLGKAEDIRARAECAQWHKNAQEFAGFYLTKGEAMQCEAVGVAVF